MSGCGTVDVCVSGVGVANGRTISDVSRKRIVIAALALVVVAACQTVPLTGRRQLLALPESTETQMGLTAYQEILQKARVSTDTVVNEQVTRVGQRIAAAAERPDYKWEFKVLDDKQVNAFCLPGGKIGVYTGILPVTKDDAGLAAVIGHEVAHATARHSGERVTQSLIAQGLLVGTTVALAGRDPRVSQAAQVGFMALATGGLMYYGRSQESEADHLGLIYMAKAGYHPSAARDLWVRMAQASGDKQRAPEFLSTHPSPETRIQQIEGWIPEALRYYKPR
jgi:predicted Zn-dependent protease